MDVKRSSPHTRPRRTVTAPDNTPPAAGATTRNHHGGPADNVRGTAKRSETARNPHGGTDGYVRGTAKRAPASNHHGAAAEYVGPYSIRMCRTPVS
ncbi:hypothetical protein JCM4914_09120 [Streptomyces platensis subsp. malvinus]